MVLKTELCQSCGMIIFKDANFCIRCGVKALVRESRDPYCIHHPNVIHKSIAVFCKICGTKLER